MSSSPVCQLLLALCVIFNAALLQAAEHKTLRSYGSSSSIATTTNISPTEHWKKLVNDLTMPQDINRQQLIFAARYRMLQTNTGQWLMNELGRLLCAKSPCNSQLHIVFSDQEFGSQGLTGSFRPKAAGKPQYRLWVRSLPPVSSNFISVTISSRWPSDELPLIKSYYGDPQSIMANSLFHELLHVWFIHAGKSVAGYESGHNNVLKNEIEPQFLMHLKRFSAELDRLEKQLKNRNVVKPRF